VSPSSRVDDALAAIRAADSEAQLDDVLAVPDHLPDALFRVESARIEPMESNGVVVCGMGGSAVGGELARAALGDRLSLPLATVRDYELAPWTSPERVVLCASYSGNTEETLACFEAAEALGCSRIVATTGGGLGEAARAAGVPVIPFPAALQPRAAVAYMFVAAAEVAGLAGASTPIRTEIDAAAASLAVARDELVERSLELADALEGTIPVVYGSDLTLPVAYRWKTQVNENAKQPAFWHEMPEADHNEIVGWAEGSGAERFSAVFLLDCDQHPRQRERIELTARLIEPAAARVEMVEFDGDARTTRMLKAVMVGDLLSLHLAARRGVDPSPVAVLEQLKEELGRP
jgi:glucose/mannose-6-phosphate isomerase